MQQNQRERTSEHKYSLTIEAPPLSHTYKGIFSPQGLSQQHKWCWENTGSVPKLCEHKPLPYKPYVHLPCIYKKSISLNCEYFVFKNMWQLPIIKKRLAFLNIFLKNLNIHI